MGQVIDMHAVVQLCTCVAAAALVMAALHDVAVRTVPNAPIIVVVVCSLALATVQHRLLASGIIAALLFLATLVPWLRGYMGGADAKLIAASGLLVPPGSVMGMLLVTSLAGGALCLPYLPGRRLFSRPAAGRPDRLLARIMRCERWRLRRRGPLPYAVAIATGTLFALLHGA